MQYDVRCSLCAFRRRLYAFCFAPEANPVKTLIRLFQGLQYFSVIAPHLEIDHPGIQMDIKYPEALYLDHRPYPVRIGFARKFGIDVGKAAAREIDQGIGQ